MGNGLNDFLSMMVYVGVGDHLMLQEQHALEMKDLKEYGENETKGLKVRYCKLHKHYCICG